MCIQKVERMMFRGTVVSTEGDAVATARVILKRVDPPALSAQAEYMTVGPMGLWRSDTLRSEAGRRAAGERER